MDPILLYIILIIVGGILIGGGVHFIPVGGAPAAMATATGVGTGTAMLAAGAGLTGLITAASLPMDQPWYIVGIAGAIGSMIMLGITMFVANLIYVYGCGVVPSASKVEVDPITGRNQEKYKTPGTEGHGVPAVSFISGLIGGLCGGLGGGLVYYAIVNLIITGKYSSLFISVNPVTGMESLAIAIGIAATLGTAIFFINSVIASYNIGGTIEGFHDPKFKRLPRGVLACLISSIVFAIIFLVLTGGI